MRKLVFLMFAGALGAWAQTAGYGTITGTLTDPKGAVIPDASVLVHNSDTNIDRVVMTNAVGLYTAPFLPPGHYEATASKRGFSKVIRKDIPLQVGQTLTLDFDMPLQSTSETVTVNSEAPIVDTEKTEMSQVVSQTLKENLPIAGRRWENFAFLTPNVTADGGSGLASYRGISALYNQSAVDGANNNQAFFSESRGRTTVPYVYSMDSIREFQVANSNYSSELGQAAGGVINAVTKSGTNDLHGDLFYFLRYPTLNALDPINKANGIYTQPVHQQQQFGGSVGGPILKDKLFYFLTYDGSRKVNPISYTSTSTFPLACTAIVTAAQCSAANGFIKSQLGAYPRFTNQDIAFGKLDSQLNPSNHVSASFDWDNFHAPNSYTTATTANNLSLSTNGKAVTHERIFVANWDATITASMINNTRFQWSRDLETIGANSTGPNVTMTNVMQYGMPNALPRPAFPDEHRLQFSDTLSVNRGRHTFKAGVDVNLIHELLINLFQGGGIYSYSGATLANFQNWVLDTYGINAGDGLTGKHYTTFVQVTDPVTGVGKDDFYNNDFDGFFEDSWKARPNLTLNLGVRYDLQLVPQPPQPNLSTPLTRYYTSTLNIDKNNFAPRLGLAWQAPKKFVIRAGYGMFYAKTSNSTYYALRAENGVIQQTFNCRPTTCPALTFPNVIYTPPGGAPQAPFAGALTPQVVPFAPPSGTQTARGMVPDFVNPLTHQGEVTVEREIPGNMSVSGSYVVSRGLRLPIFVDANLAPTTTTKTYDLTNSAGVTQSTLTLPFYTSRTDATGPILAGFSDVNTWYNSFVLSVRKRLSHGVEFLANYTLAKATDGGQVPGQFGTFNGTDSPVDPHNRKQEYALSDLDQRHSFVTSVVWIPPTRKISNRPLRLVVDGFTFSGIGSISSGHPITGQISGFPSGGPDGGLTGGLVNNSGTGIGGRLPGVVRNLTEGPNYRNLDLRVSREFRFTERLRLGLGLDMINAFNHTNILSVNTTQYSFTASGSGVCAGHANGCVVPSPTFFAPVTTTNGIAGARQLQISGRITF